MGDPLRLYGLKAIVTNAGSGIGEAVARTLIKHGAKVMAVDTLNSGVEQHFASVKGVDGHSEAYTDPGRLPALIESAVEKLGGIDILVTDFALTFDGPIESAGEAFDRLLSLRADLILSMARGSLPHLKKSPAGRIINLGFMRSMFAAGGVAPCDKAEKNLADITRALAAEAGEFGITANYVQPGAVMTPTSREVFRKNKELRDYCIANSAARRLGEPVDVAKVVLFLASDDATFVSGTGIAVNGGRLDD
jgi:3-oxoacyl-[acyl-carrier protein] reductase